MGKRLERYHRVRKEKKIKRQRFLIVFLMVIFFLTGLVIVDNSLREMMCIEDKGLFDILKIEENYDITFIGKNFHIDSKDIKTFLKVKTDLFLDEVFEIFNTIVGKISSEIIY